VAQKEVTINYKAQLHSIRSIPGNHTLFLRERERRDRSDHAHWLNATNWEFAARIWPVPRSVFPGVWAVRYRWRSWQTCWPRRSAATKNRTGKEEGSACKSS